MSVGPTVGELIKNQMGGHCDRCGTPLKNKDGNCSHCKGPKTDQEAGELGEGNGIITQVKPIKIRAVVYISLAIAGLVIAFKGML